MRKNAVEIMKCYSNIRHYYCQHYLGITEDSLEVSHIKIQKKDLVVKMD